MAQKQPTPPVQGGAGNVTCLAACEVPKDTLIPLRAQLLVERFAVPAAIASVLAHHAWGSRHG